MITIEDNLLEPYFIRSDSVNVTVYKRVPEDSKAKERYTTEWYFATVEAAIKRIIKAKADGLDTKDDIFVDLEGYLHRAKQSREDLSDLINRVYG